MTKRMWAAMVAVALLLAALPFNLAFAAQTRMVRCNLILREKASADSKSIKTIPGGTMIEVLGTSGGWTKTNYEGHDGYVSTKYLVDLTRSGYYPLKEGDRSQYVKELHEQLIKLGYMDGTAGDEYTAKTTQAVKAFQKANGIDADGMAGGETQRTLYGDMAKGSDGGAGLSSESESTGSTSTNTDNTSKISSTTLRMGNRGDDVKNLQTRLIELGYLTGRADGIFGSATQKAVVAFQKQSGISADGLAGKVMQGLLYSSSAKKADGSVSGGSASNESSGTEGTSTSYTTLKHGMTSDAIKKMQNRLKELGYMTASATGYFGSQTLAGLKSFQETNGLAVDGIAGASTQTALYASSAKKAGSSSSSSSTESTTYVTLKEGMKSSAVTTMQKKLRDLGFLSASATGYFGSQTKAAVVAFQKKNGLSADGIAGSATLAKLYGDPVGSGSSSGGSSSTGKISGPNGSQVKLLHWFNSVKPSLKNGSTMVVFDPSTNYSWNLRAMSLGRHCDSEPITAADTAIMNTAFGNKTTWTPKVVYIKLPSGTWTMATMHNTPHLSGGIKDNNFDGHLCVHFLRDMSEVSKNDPSYGVQNQNVLRDAWKKLTGETVN